MPRPASDHVAIDAAHARVGVREDRRQREEHQGREGIREADAKQRHEDDEQGVGRHRPPQVADRDGRRRAAARMPDEQPDRDRDQRADEDGETRQDDVLQQAVGYA
jgi:hypothetical protein